jgi:hypothetical protein
VSDRTEDQDFYLASNPNESGVIAPEQLTPLWRNLKQKDQHRINATTLDQLAITHADAMPESSNWAVIDCLPAMPIIKGATQQLAAWDVIIARVVLDDSQLQTHGASKAELDAQLAEHGYRCIACEEELQPAIGRALYIRDWKIYLGERVDALQQKATSLKDELDASLKAEEVKSGLLKEQEQHREAIAKEIAEKAKSMDEQQTRIGDLEKVSNAQAALLAERQTRIEQHQQEIEARAKVGAEQLAHIQQLVQARDEQAKLVAEQHSKIQQLTQSCDEQTKLANDRQYQIVQLTKERDTQTQLAEERKMLLDRQAMANGDQAAQMLEQLTSQSNRLEKMEAGLKHQLKKGLENSTRQIEAFIGIETYLSKGHLLPALHGWPISADFALYLIALIEKKNYDLIIEFGSGASTVLMASVIVKQMKRLPLREIDVGDRLVQAASRRVDSEDSSRSISMTVREQSGHSTADADVMPRIVSFEHHRQYFEETKNKLQQADVAQVVELIHAPLRDYQAPSGDQYLYYGCEEKFAAMANHFNGQRANILLLVDGPPGATHKHARYPALPIALQYLASHNLDVLMDDAGRVDEKEIIGRWEELLGRRSLAFEKTELVFEKGACLLAIK